MGLFSLLFIYVLGGVTFLPLVLSILFLHAYFTLPVAAPHTPSRPLNTSFSGTSDELDEARKSSTDALEEKFKRTHESDVAAGYFVICTNYTPAGINGRPPERTTPAGEVVAQESPGYYSSVYRSLFERKADKGSLEPGKKDGKIVKRALNVFYVVLRLGHLVLFDDEQMIEPRFVIPVANHSISIYGGVNPVPEGELWIKRNAICLTPKPFLKADPEKEPTTYYIFSEDCSKKEDFYFALLQNQEKVAGSVESPPKTQEFDVDHIVTLVKRLHSSEQQLQTRWINALMGRLFLALYRTPFLEQHFRRKITKKISRVAKPNFITKIALQSIDLGEGAPFITNPRLKDLTVDGDCCVEADVDYSGGLRVELGATARIELGQRFKAREVDLVLAVVIKRLKGHGLLRFKPPPSNRIWVTFEKMPEIEMKIEPIVSTRQISYGIVLQAIERRIRETFAESLVLPYWDDTAFFETYDQHFRGGIWEAFNPSTGPVGEGSSDGTQAEDNITIEAMSKEDRAMSMPAMPTPRSKSLKSRRSSHAKSTQALVETPEAGDGISSSLERSPKPPRVLRSQSFAAAANPVATPNDANADLETGEPKRNSRGQSRADATSVLMALNKSQPGSPAETPIGSPPNEPDPISSRRGQSGSTSSGASQEQIIEGLSRTDSLAPSESLPPTPKSAEFGLDSKRSSMLESVTRSLTPSDKIPTTSIGKATAAAKTWGWNVLQKRQSVNSAPDRAGTPENPIGRGRPLPPPGTPLPPPERIKTAASSISIPKRKPVPPPLLPEKAQEQKKKRRPVPNPPLPPRRVSRGLQLEESAQDELLVVAAPPESEPTTPNNDQEDFIGSMDLDDEKSGDGDSQPTPPSVSEDAEDVEKAEDLAEPPPEPPPSRESKGGFLRGRLSSSPEEDGKSLPSWSAAEEEESRSKSIWTIDNEHA